LPRPRRPRWARWATGAARAARSAETVVELTYLYAARSWLSVQPSLQRIRHPGASPGLRDATVGLLRCEISL